MAQRIAAREQLASTAWQSGRRLAHVKISQLVLLVGEYDGGPALKAAATALGALETTMREQADLQRQRFRQPSPSPRRRAAFKADVQRAMDSRCGRDRRPPA